MNAHKRWKLRQNWRQRTRQSHQAKHLNINLPVYTPRKQQLVGDFFKIQSVQLKSEKLGNAHYALCFTTECTVNWYYV